MNPQALMLAALAIPLAGAVLIVACGRRPNLREAATLTTAVALFAVALGLTGIARTPFATQLVLAEPIPGIPVAFSPEPLGALFACLASGLWILNSVYSIGYMRGNAEPRQTQFYALFAVSIGAAMGIALAANLVTLFICYEVLTIATYPLVTHKGTADARAGGRTYIGLLLGGSIFLLLPAIIVTWLLSASVTFTPGGVLAGKLSAGAAAALYTLFAFGVGKAALMPLHRWLPAAMVAPTPVSALLHAVAVVKAGVFTVLKITIYIFGIDFLQATGASRGVAWIAAITILAASLIALTRQNLKARLAYSTISQLSYVILGAALANGVAIAGAGMQLLMHAMGKITLFFCAGAIYTATHKTEIPDLRGLGRAMPFTFVAFALGSLSIIGLPPFGGMWSKWLLIDGSIDANHLFFAGVFIVSSLLNVAYLLPIFVRGFYPAERELGYHEAPALCLLPLCITALGCLALFFCAEPIYRLLAAIPLHALP